MTSVQFDTPMRLKGGGEGGPTGRHPELTAEESMANKNLISGCLLAGAGLRTAIDAALDAALDAK